MSTFEEIVCLLMFLMCAAIVTMTIVISISLDLVRTEMGNIRQTLKDISWKLYWISEALDEKQDEDGEPIV